ncbi:hypothetical protein IVA87_22765 [Bradyrhizobium sp. 147]|uniref:hypothetical protein n=1 Tax=Bradyrhizobium sp. 147 TaxID=2782623 RepID=UPI001FFB4978|nr:hypothetical protein [Bradyrhizobium sp. 147]MCK1682161.1 hypothetical protein [Bradyrhizobium sp. 147]
MAQVDSENSTAMPVVSTRRHFLSQAAAVAAGSAALGAALPLSGSAAGAGQAPEGVAPLLRRPMLAMDGLTASDELRSAFRELEDAHKTLKTAWVEYRRVVDLLREWEREHPFSGGGSNRAFRKWERRYRKYLDEMNWGPVGKVYHEARRDFEEAKIAAARVKVRDIDELALKACGVYVYEDVREGEHLRGIPPAIAISVAVDLARMSLPERAAA